MFGYTIIRTEKLEELAVANAERRRRLSDILQEANDLRRDNRALDVTAKHYKAEAVKARAEAAANAADAEKYRAKLVRDREQKKAKRAAA